MPIMSGKKAPDWNRFGLSTPLPEQRSPGMSESSKLRDPLIESGYYGGKEQELFMEEKGQSPWWTNRQFFVKERLLFGKWDGVFTSCLVNLLGVIIFLRSGWIIAEAGFAMAAVIVLLSVLVVLTSVLSAVGICERSASNPLPGEDSMANGGVYYLVAHVLGGQIGGAVGLVYCFGQTVGIALCVAGFAESILELFSLPHWSQTLIADTALLLLAFINIAGVKWVVKVQFLLLLVIFLAVLDIVVGSFLPSHDGTVTHQWSTETFNNNLKSSYSEGYSAFTVAGVFFPAVTGIMAGINMSGDLKNPSVDIPVGTISALGFSTVLYLLIMLVLAATVDRSVLLTDFMITEKVSAVGVLLMLGLYTSSLSSSLASLYATPRVLQSIAAEGTLPLFSGLSRGKGPNKVPIYGVCMVVFATSLFILLGNINVLAPIVTTPFLLTYAAVDYSYFVLAVTADLRTNRDLRGSANQKDFSRTANQGVLDSLFPERVTEHKKISTSAASSDTSSGCSTPDEDTLNTQLEVFKTQESAKSIGSEISAKTNRWYSFLCNRWIALLGAILKITVMVAINWVYGMVTLGITLVVYLYVGHAAPGLPPGLAADFSLLHWIKVKFLICFGRAPPETEQLVVPPLHPGVEVEASQLNENNEDFASRSRYHSSTGGNTMPPPH